MLIKVSFKGLSLPELSYFSIFTAVPDVFLTSIGDNCDYPEHQNHGLSGDELYSKLKDKVKSHYPDIKQVSFLFLSHFSVLCLFIYCIYLIFLSYLSIYFVYIILLSYLLSCLKSSGILRVRQ